MPLTSIAREELLALHKESGWSEYVFVNSKTFKPLTDVKKAFTYALRKAGIEDFHFHDLRHTCATRLGDRGASAFEIAQIMGWSDIRMAMRYTHATGDGIRRAMQLLTQTGVGKGGKVVQLQNWTDTKVATSNGNGQHALPVNAVCRACSTARRCKSSTQPDGGEELAKRKGVVVRRGLKEAWSKGASR